MKRFALSLLVATTTSAAVLLGGVSPAQAEPPKTAGAGATDPAAAQALFYEARTLMKEGKLAAACPKLEESLRLDYGVGTEFNLADCNEKLGKVASAWSGFLSTAAASKAQNQPQREKVARDRAKALEPRLPKLTIEVLGSTTPGLEVKRDGTVIGSASWGSASPVDPGSHRITASAPGRQSWEGAVSAAEGKIAKITIPALAADIQPVAIVPPAAAPAPAATTAAAQQHAPDTFPPPVVERGSTQRTIGWFVGAMGLAGLGVSAGFGIDSLQKRERSRDHCDGNVCDSTGLALRDRAMTSGDVATIVGISGGAAVLGGLVLVLTAPRGQKEAPSTSAKLSSSPPPPRLSAFPNIAMNGGGLTIQGVLP